MMKTAGGLMIVAAFIYAGLTLIRSKREHLTALKDFCAALWSLHAELETRFTSLPDAAAALRKAGDVSKAFFSYVGRELSCLGELAFSEIWAEAAEHTLTVFDPDEKSAVAALGQALGTYTLDEQLAAIDLCRKKLEKSCLTAEKELADYSRTCLGVCSALGIMLVLVLF